MTQLQQASGHNQPAYKLTLAGEDITSRVQSRLSSLTLTDNRGMEADQLDLTLDDHDGLLSIPRTGVQLQLSIGWTGALVDKGSFTVDESSHSGAPDQLTIRARSVNLREGMNTKQERSWHRTTLGDIVTTIAKANDLKPVISAQFRDVEIKHQDQTNESDLNLLTRLAKENDAIATVKNGSLLFIVAGEGVTASGKPVPPYTLRRSAGDQHNYSVADRDAYSGVKAYWQDTNSAAKKEVIEGGGDNLKTLRHTYASETSALRAAKAEFRKIKRGKSAFSLTLAMGNPLLYPETPVRCIGWKKEINETPWVISKVTHNISDSGYTCSLELEELSKEDSAEEDQKYTGIRAKYFNKKTNKTGSVLVGKEGNVRTLPHTYATEKNAKKAADREWKKLQNSGA